MTSLLEKDFEAFFRLPFEVYGPDVNYVSPMKSDLRRFLSARDNPLFASEDDFTYFVAQRAGRLLGRIAVHHHAASNERFCTRRGCFGFFDCADDEEAARHLLDAAANWARAKGFDELVGNFNLTAMQQCGVQTGGFGKAGFTDMIVNAPHIPSLLESNGFKPTFPMTTFSLDLSGANLPEIRQDASSGIEFLPIRRRDFAGRMEQARVVLNDGFADNPMFVPLSSEEFLFQAEEMKAIMDPRLSSVVVQEGEPVGVVICIPDLNGLMAATGSRFHITTPWHYLRYRLRRWRAVIIFYSVSRSHHGRGIMGRILARTVRSLRNGGYEQLGVTWIADQNKPSLRQMEKLGAEPLHRLYLFRKALL